MCLNSMIKLTIFKSSNGYTLHIRLLQQIHGSKRIWGTQEACWVDPCRTCPYSGQGESRCSGFSAAGGCWGWRLPAPLTASSSLTFMTDQRLYLRQYLELSPCIDYRHLQCPQSTIETFPGHRTRITDHITVCGLSGLVPRHLRYSFN